MKNNTELFDYSLQNPEPLVDDYYVKGNDLIISSSPDKPNELMKINRELLDNITAFRIAINQGNDEMRATTLKTVQSLMRNKGLNFSEFASFWAVTDVSHSLYISLSEAEQLAFLDPVIQKYIDVRHGTYLQHGYSATTLQVGKDAKAHKSNGSLGGIKVATILSENGYTQLTDLRLDSLKNGDNIFLLSDKNGKKLFKEILNNFKINFLWSSHTHNKMPDVLFRKGKHIFIVEHKHMKEGGGGQDKQVAEVVNFIGYSEPTAVAEIHYITFIDGRYFNRFTRQSDKHGKLEDHIATIRKNLKTNKKNYFVNTAGFRELLKQIITV
jgi:hypothetical protein